MNPSHLAGRRSLWLLSSASSTLLTLAGWLIVLQQASAQQPELEVRFSQDIQPLLARRCFACHGPDQAEAGLRLNSREQAIA
ncbi:MAG: c-type cytochrome domain-containing protein, partial [Pirellula sp.]